MTMAIDLSITTARCVSAQAESRRDTALHDLARAGSQLMERTQEFRSEERHVRKLFLANRSADRETGR